MDLRKIPCPNCKRRGLHYSMHPHAFRWKDYDHVECRFCGKRYLTTTIEKRVEEAER